MKNRPNVLLIIADQLAWKALPAYGNARAETPNIDHIAAKGVRFDNCVTPCPLCQPARAALNASSISDIRGFLQEQVIIRRNYRWAK